MKKTNTILLLESDTVLAEEMKVCLRNFGYDVFHQPCKSDIFPLVLKEKPDLVLMEVKPGEELKSAEIAQTIHDNYLVPVIFLTSFESKKIIEKSKRQTLQSFVLKPLIERELISTVELTLFRHAMERKLQESEKKYNELSNSILQVIVECDLAGKILSINRHGLEMLGLGTCDLEKGVMLTDYVRNNEHGSILEVSEQSSFIDSANLNREFVLVNKFNKKYIIEELLSPVYCNYKLSGYRGILIDVTNRKLKQSLCTLFGNVNHLYDRADADISEISDYIVAEMKEIVPDLDTIYFENLAEGAATHLNEINPGFEGYTKFVVDSNKPLLLRGKEFDTFNRRQKFQNPVNQNACWMAFPIVSKIEPYGVFVLSSNTNRNALSIKDFEKLIDFFENVNLFLEKVSYLKELKRSENLFKSLVNTINEGLVKIDLDSTITFANERLNDISGYNQVDVIGKKCKTFLKKEDLKALAKIIEARKNGSSSQYEMNIKIKSGDFKNFYISGAPYRDERGIIIGAIGIFTDISAKMEQLALFAATENLLREITSAIDVAFWIYSFETKKILYLSPAFKTIFEVELEQIYNMNSWLEFIHPEDMKAVLERNSKDLGGGESEIKYRIMTPGGTHKWIRDKAVLIKDQEGNAIKIIGYAQEITQLKLTEERFLKGETEKDNIIRSIPDSFMVIDKEDKILNSYFKASESEFFYSRTKKIQGKKIDKVFDDRIAEIIIENAHKSYTSSETILFELDVHLDTLVTWYEIRMTSMNDEKILMIIRNITFAKNVNNIQKLFNITEQTQELIMITDSVGKVEYVNPKFTSTTGYESEEIVGHKPSLLKSSRHSRSFYSDLWNTLNAGEIFKADFYNTKKSGELFIEEKIITPYLDINGEITNFISTGRDVTLERRNALKTKRHKHLESTLALKQQKSRTLSLIQGHENERRKFAREIHEGLNQMLSVAMMNLENISTNELINVEQRGKIEFVNKMVSEIMQELRGISTDLSPVSLFEFGLYAVIQQMVNNLNSKLKTVNISFKSNIAGLRFKEETEINFYRIIQEAIQNALKHSKAKKINIALNFSNGKLIFLIKDDGVGINKRELDVKKKKLFGISTLEERAAVMGAQLEITTNKNKGFEINIAVKTKTITYDKNTLS